MGAGTQQVDSQRRACRAAVWIALVLALIPGVVGCRERDPSLQRVQASGVLRVGIDPAWPPFGWVDESGAMVGLDIDLAHAIAGRLGIEVAFVPSGWEGLYDALRAGHFDAVISALPYDARRTREVAYSAPYLAGGIVVVAPTGAGIGGTGDLRGRTVHVEYGSEGEVQARRLERSVPNMSIAPHDTAEQALRALAGDPQGAALVDAVGARLYIREEPGLQIVGDPLYDESYVIAVPHEARSLLEAIDRALLDMREDGELDALLDRWL